ncbi:hypothetical protein BEH94_08495 [Candidatus Altiarchaeales archaeon WOR_SM1_SCG]|nr:hypothetical protein BEH94_08495 [Candidatus Altiarchaeales archaeon WOR_SM1_SCG]
MIKQYIPYFIFLFLTLIFCTLILTAPLTANLAEKNQKNSIISLVSKLNYNLFQPLCHQKPERSFFAFGHKLAVCARCAGIYAGALILTIIYPFVKNINNNSTPSKYYLVACLIPMALDGGTQFLNFRESFNELRFATGFIAGSVFVFYLIPVLSRLFIRFAGELKLKI